MVEQFEDCRECWIVKVCLVKIFDPFLRDLDYIYCANYGNRPRRLEKCRISAHMVRHIIGGPGDMDDIKVIAEKLCYPSLNSGVHWSFCGTIGLKDLHDR